MVADDLARGVGVSVTMPSDRFLVAVLRMGVVVTMAPTVRAQRWAVRKLDMPTMTLKDVF